MCEHPADRFHDIREGQQVAATTNSGQRVMVEVDEVDEDPEDRDSLTCVKRVSGETVTGKEAVVELMSSGRVRVAYMPYGPSHNVDELGVVG